MCMLQQLLPHLVGADQQQQLHALLDGLCRQRRVRERRRNLALLKRIISLGDGLARHAAICGQRKPVQLML